MNSLSVHANVEGVGSVHPQDLHRRIAAGEAVELLDVRTQPEYDTEHVACARLLPLDQLDVGAFLRERGGSEQPLYVICQSGARAAKAVEKFKNAGFQRCVLVEGGTQAWIDAGLPVERGESKVLPLIRQVQIVIGAVSALGAGLAIWVNPLFAIIPLFTGCGLLFAGLTGTCGLAILLAKMPWNRKSSCDSGSCCGVKH
ncbi:MAG: rhodanese-like domain-containing protein [Verrucomicrobia bacterium]|nr:rhodanese-like domain-containing protein [Verrucomicrobiota bacterium]